MGELTFGPIPGEHRFASKKEVWAKRFEDDIRVQQPNGAVFAVPAGTYVIRGTGGFVFCAADDFEREWRRIDIVDVDYPALPEWKGE